MKSILGIDIKDTDFGIAYTDMQSVFINPSLSDRERKVAVKHEVSHIVLYHLQRVRSFKKEHTEISNEKINIAMDVEIARLVYTADDENTIKSPRSRLKGGIVSDTFDIPSDVKLWEDIIWLLPENPPINSPFENINDDGNQMADADIRSIVIEKIAEQLKKDIDSSQAQEHAQHAINEASLKKRPPTLAGEIDALLRIRTERIRSYARPSRLESEKNIMLKGYKTKHFQPRIEIYMDRSGSFTPEKTAAANEKLIKILKKYRASVKNDTFFFGGDKLSSSDFDGGGNTPYHLVFESLKNNIPEIAVIVTDDDGCDYYGALSSYTKVFCVPIGSEKTNVAEMFGGMDVEL